MTNEDWNFEDSRNSDFSIIEIINFIEPFYQPRDKDKIRFLHHGSFNVYEVDEYIFRIPDSTLFNERGYHLIHNEIKKLNFLQSKISLKIPNPIFASNNPELPIVGYRKIPGISIEKIWKSIPQTNKLLLAEKIGLFLKNFHNESLALEYSQELGIPTKSKEDLITDYENILSKSRNLIFPLIKPDLQFILEQLITNFLEDLENNDLQFSLIHGDFDTSNILIDEKTFDIVGIIDFEDTGFGDPASDLIFLNKGEKFQNILLKSYSNKKDKFLESRIKFYFKRTGIPYLLYGLEHNLPDMVKYGKFVLEKRNL